MGMHRVHVRCRGDRVLSAVGLLLGFWRNKLVSVFSGVLIMVMAGAVVTHLKSGQGLVLQRSH